MNIEVGNSVWYTLGITMLTETTLLISHIIKCKGEFKKKQSV